MLPLARAAGRVTSMAELMENWHEPSLVLADLHRNRVTISDQLDVQVENRKQLVATGKELVITLLDRLFRLAKTGHTPVRTLDISGFPLTCELLANVVTKFCEIDNPCTRPQLTLVLDLYLTDQDCRNLNKLEHLRKGVVRVRVRHIYFSVLTYGRSLSWQVCYHSWHQDTV